MAKLDDIEVAFDNIKGISENGAALIETLRVVDKKMLWITQTFEAGINDPVWVGNFTMLTGQESMDYSFEVYNIYKEAQAKLAALG